ncbi:MAG: NgoFVII family restriction endonuclease [Candidatus Gastranaerophilales bacterium]|nr:NgoFVII family restriction endonuclease [Candidatus Gastranaerophilales bacterium]
MTELLFSNLPPIRFSNKKTFSKCFKTLFEDTDKVCIATGYISTDALTELKSIAEANNKSIVLVIGMHFFEGMTKVQYQAANYLNEFLMNNSLGGVYVTNTFKFHGKLYTFHKENNIIAGILGSSNLNSILENHSNYETDIMLDNKALITEMDEFIVRLIDKTCIPLTDWEPETFVENNLLLEGHDNVKHCSSSEISNVISSTTDVIFRIPIKPFESAPKSNVNAYFGEGRKNKRGFVQPRHWYEVELIVPKAITDNSNYPKAGYPKTESIITVYTDDCWKFDCKISGTNSKNFRSCDDLKILGKWIKGRLENYGSLKVGEPLTEAVLKDYGRNYIEMRGSNDPKIWYLNFSPRGNK